MPMHSIAKRVTTGRTHLKFSLYHFQNMDTNQSATTWVNVHRIKFTKYLWTLISPIGVIPLYIQWTPPAKKMTFRPFGPLPTVSAHFDFYPCPTWLLTVYTWWLGDKQEISTGVAWLLHPLPEDGRSGGKSFQAQKESKGCLDLTSNPGFMSQLLNNR